MEARSPPRGCRDPQRLQIADLDATLAEVRSYLTFGNIEEVRESTLAAVEKYGAKLTADSPELPHVAHALLRAGAEALGILRRRALGDWSDPLPSPLAPVRGEYRKQVISEPLDNRTPSARDRSRRVRRIREGFSVPDAESSCGEPLDTCHDPRS
jgi:hypothetical protein